MYSAVLNDTPLPLINALPARSPRPYKAKVGGSRPSAPTEEPAGQAPLKIPYRAVSCGVGACA